MNIDFKRNQINLQALDAELRGALADTLSGVSFDGVQVIVHLDDSVTPTQIGIVGALVEAHDPTKLTPAQESENARAALLTQMRQERQPLDADKLGATASDIKALGRRIALLELEIDALRGR